MQPFPGRKLYDDSLKMGGGGSRTVSNTTLITCGITPAHTSPCTHISENKYDVLQVEMTFFYVKVLIEIFWFVERITVLICYSLSNKCRLLLNRALLINSYDILLIMLIESYFQLTRSKASSFYMVLLMRS